jgi:hypothetical protein
MKYVFFAAAMVLATTGFAQKVSNKLNFQKGQKLQMTVKINSSLASAMGDTKVEATVTRIFDIQDAGSSSTTIEHKIKRLQFNVESAMGAQTFDSENPKDMNSPNGKTIAKSIKNKYTMTIDAAGQVTAVKKDDDNPNTKDDAPGVDMMSNLLAQMSEGLKVPVPGDKTEFDILPAYEVGKGDSWTDSTTNRKTVYTVSDITDNDILLTFTQDETIATKQTAMGMEINISSKDKTTGHITIDRKTGLLKEKTGDTDSEGTVDAMGQSMPMTKKISRIIQVSDSK